MLDFSTLQGLTIPEGIVVQIEKDNNILWEKVNKKRLYKNGNLYTDITGGWTVDGVSWTGSGTYFTAGEFLEDSIYLNGSNTRTGFATVNKVDVGDYTYIKAKVKTENANSSNTFNLVMGTTCTFGNSAFVNATIKTGSEDYQIVEAKIGRTGSFYIGFMAYQTCIARVYEIWLE